MFNKQNWGENILIERGQEKKYTLKHTCLHVVS